MLLFGNYAAEQADLQLQVHTEDLQVIQRRLLYQWTTDNKLYPTEPRGDFVQASRLIHDKYSNWFTPTCV